MNVTSAPRHSIDTIPADFLPLQLVIDANPPTAPWSSRFVIDLEPDAAGHFDAPTWTADSWSGPVRSTSGAGAQGAQHDAASEALRSALLGTHLMQSATDFTGQSTRPARDVMLRFTDQRGRERNFAVPLTNPGIVAIDNFVRRSYAAGLRGNDGAGVPTSGEAPVRS